jgi:hypothetical protein
MTSEHFARQLERTNEAMKRLLARIESQPMLKDNLSEYYKLVTDNDVALLSWTR